MKMNYLNCFKAILFLCLLSLPAVKASAQYCSPTYFQGCVFGNEVNDFKLTGESGTSIIDLATGCSMTSGGIGGGYDDRTAESVTLYQGTNYTVALDDAAAAFGTDNVQIWIDFNNNFTFDATESIGGGALPALTGALTNFTLTIPATATLGSHRMRVAVSADGTYPSVNPCPSGLSSLHGEIHDYTVVIATPTTSTCPAVTGLSVSSITATSAVLNWTAASGAIGYEWVVDMVATAPTGSGTATTLTTATATGLTASTNYYAHVRTKCSASSFSTWVTVPFTTSATTSTCTAPTLTLGAGTSTTQIVNWTAITGATGYEWVVDMSASAPTGSGTATTLTTFTASGLTPSTAYYAHVRTNCGTSFSSWATIPFTTGASTTTCDTVTGLSMSSITTTSAILNWTAVTGSVGYEWVVNTIAAAPTGSGTGTTLTTATASGLTAGTLYYAHVRNKCSATSFSNWITISFATLSAGCNPVTGLTASAITATSATVSWTAVTGSVGYQYVINNIATSPTGSGTNTAATSTSPTGLTPGTTYYAHVRDSCGLTSFSVWNTIPFTTLSATCNAVTGLTASAITSTSATVSWTPATGALGSQYVINTNPADPLTSGTPTTLTSTNATGLTPATTYYAHVRDSCGATALSAWVTIPLTTLAGTGISNVNAPGTDFGLSAYPNPAGESINVEVHGNIYGNAMIQLIDITGKLIRTISLYNNSINVDLSGLQPGIYLIRYIDSEHTQAVRITKQ